MKHVNMKMVLGLTISMLFLIGLAAPVSALQTNIKIDTYNQGYSSGANNHTYVYVEPDPLNFVSRSTIYSDEDLDYRFYNYLSSGWSSPVGSLNAESNFPYLWDQFIGWSTGPFGNPALMPEFYDYEASDGSEFVFNTTLETHTFGLSLGQHTAVLADEGYYYYGTLGLSGQEFIHLTVDSRQDDIVWYVDVYDPEGRYITGYTGTEGNIWTLPFKASVAGTYYVMLYADPVAGTFGLFDFLPVAVTPQSIAADSVVTGELPTGEQIVRGDTGSWVHSELAPTVHTYQVNSPNDVASLTYAFNYPELPIFFGLTQPPEIQFTSSDWVYYYDGGRRYSDGIGGPTTGDYYFRGGPYYVTVMGGDNVAYTLYHRSNSQGELPLNQEFRFENYLGVPTTHAYTLDIEEPSILRVNSTETGGDLDIYLIGTLEDGYFTSRTISYGTNLLGSDEYYLPVGEYFVEMDIAAGGINEWVEFNIGALTTNTTAEIVEIGGFFVDTEVFEMYNMTIFINNEDNVTAALDVTLYDASGDDMHSAGMLLANRWDGSQILPHPTYWDNATFTYNRHDWHDSYAFVGICAYLVEDNTDGSSTNYADYPLDLTIEWTSRLNDYFTNIVSLDVSSGAASHNFTLPHPGSATEFHGLMLNSTPGTWYNVSVKTADINGRTGVLYSRYDGRTHSIPWSSLNDEYVGVISDYSFQFGAISDSLFLELEMDRDPGPDIDGFIWIEITPMETHQLDVQQITPLGPDILAILGGVVLPVAVGVGVIVVVYIVYVKRIKK